METLFPGTYQIDGLLLSSSCRRRKILGHAFCVFLVSLPQPVRTGPLPVSIHELLLSDAVSSWRITAWWRAPSRAVSQTTVVLRLVAASWFSPFGSPRARKHWGPPAQVPHRATSPTSRSRATRRPDRREREIQRSHATVTDSVWDGFDNDSDNDTQRSPSNNRQWPGLPGVSEGVMTPRKSLLKLVWLALLARFAL